MATQLHAPRAIAPPVYTLAPVDPTLPFELRDGRYVCMRLLGAGAQGQTYEAVDKQAGRLVAVKRFEVRGARSWKDVELAEREARVLANLHHPALPALVEHFEEGGCLYLAMERIEGADLASDTHGSRLGLLDVLRLLETAADVLHYLHGRAPPVIHRDLKPGNIIRKPDGSFAFVDFGSVRDRLRADGGSTLAGTFGFMAPEQLQGRALPATDVYAIGATALALLTGSPPEELPHKGLRIDVAAALPGADPTLLRVLHELTSPDPDERPASLGPAVVALRPLREALERHGAPPPPPAPAGAPGHGGGQRRAPPRSLRLALSKPLLLAVLTTALFLARVVVALVVQLGVPLLLGLLSVFFGRALLKVASAVRGAGKLADRWLVSRTAQLEETADQLSSEREQRRVRVEEQSSRVRVDASDSDFDAADVDSEEDDGKSAAKRARREAKDARRQAKRERR